MKSLKPFVLLIAAIFSLGAFAQRNYLSDAQEQAQSSLIKYLRLKSYSPSIDPNDQSVCFKKDDILYWVTFDTDRSPILYTLHRRPIRFADNDSKDVNRRREIAEKAANMVCAERTVKAFLNNNKVEFCFPIYASTPEDYQKVFSSALAAFKNIKKSFDDNYAKARVRTDSIHNYWCGLDTTIVVVAQTGSSSTQSQKMLNIRSISARVVDNGDNVISDYDKGIRKSNCQFLQERIEVSALKDGVYKVGVKLYNPEGKLLVPSKDARFTTITTIEIKKAEKVETHELLKFGSTDKDIWQPGEYKIEFYEDDTKIFTDAINIL